MPLDPLQLKARVGSGLLSFPVTDFRAGRFDAQGYAARLAWLISAKAIC